MRQRKESPWCSEDKCFRTSSLLVFVGKYDMVENNSKPNTETREYPICRNASKWVTTTTGRACSRSYQEISGKGRKRKKQGVMVEGGAEAAESIRLFGPYRDKTNRSGVIGERKREMLKDGRKEHLFPRC